MPVVSKAQQGFMGAHKNDAGPLGGVARDFLSAGPAGGKYSDLPERVGKQGNHSAGAAVKKGFSSLFRKGKK
jgi:hypothetical protein